MTSKSTDNLNAIDICDLVIDIFFLIEKEKKTLYISSFNLLKAVNVLFVNIIRAFIYELLLHCKTMDNLSG